MNLQVGNVYIRYWVIWQLSGGEGFGEGHQRAKGVYQHLAGQDDRRQHVAGANEEGYQECL